MLGATEVRGPKRRPWALAVFSERIKVSILIPFNFLVLEAILIGRVSVAANFGPRDGG